MRPHRAAGPMPPAERPTGVRVDSTFDGPLAEFAGWAEEALKASGKVTATVGIFDSGIGGLTVYRRLRAEYPRLNVIYFADMLRQPYGPRSQLQVSAFCDQIMRFLLSEGAGLAIIACNTATAATFDNQVNFKPHFSSFPILGTIPYAAKAALAPRKSAGTLRHVGVIATEGTVNSGAYARALTGFASAHTISCVVTSMPCPEFMQLAESGEIWTEKTLTLARQYMRSTSGANQVPVNVGKAVRTRGDSADIAEGSAESKGISGAKSRSIVSAPMDTIIYGCTHYPLLSEVCQHVVHVEFGRKEVSFIDPADALVEELAPLVEDPEQDAGWTRFCVNGDPASFDERASRVLGCQVKCECVQLPPLEPSDA